MDYKDFQAGATQEHFWFKAKAGLVEILMHPSIRFVGDKSLGTAADKGAKILSVGAGTGEDLEILARHGSVYAIDIDQQALDLIPAHLITEKKQADACALPYPDNYFDAVVALDVIEHIQDDGKAVAQIYRVLKPGGMCVITLPAFNALFSGHDKALGHYRRYNKPMVKKLFHAFTKQDAGYWFFSGFVPTALMRLATKNSNSSSMRAVPGWVNSFCGFFLGLENWMIKKGVRFPFGLTLFAIYKK